MNWYNQIPHSALKTKRETTKHTNQQQPTKGTRGKPNEQPPFQTGGHPATQKPPKHVTNITAEPKHKHGQQEQATAMNHNRSTTLERSVSKYWGPKPPLI